MELLLMLAAAALGTPPVSVPEIPASVIEVRLRGLDTPSVRAYLTREPSPFPLSITSPPKELAEVIHIGAAAVPALMERLSSGSRIERAAAWRALINITPKQFGTLEEFMGEDATSREKREVSVGLWRGWWKANSEKHEVEWLIDELESATTGDQRPIISRLGSTARVLAQESRPVPARRRAIDRLRECAKVSDTRASAVLALADLQDRCVVPDIVDVLLQDSETWMRSNGIRLLVELTGRTFGFDPFGTREARQRGVSEWQAWWREKGRREYCRAGGARE